MPEIIVKAPFLFAHHGYQVEAFEPGPRDTTEECAAVAVAEGWATLAGEKAAPAAPENKDAAPKRKTKAA